MLELSGQASLDTTRTEVTIVSQTNIEIVSKATLGKLLGNGMERIWAFPSAEIPSRTEMTRQQCGVRWQPTNDLTGTVSLVTLGKLLGNGMEHIWAFPSI